ncbi:pyruvate ferredoxin oxidoreductase subunit gamma [Halapricum salinum]|uniref:pyruvate synthase n=1 Tax=Halapricum salinum TaxID=1457250 RepID=A0A4D6HGM8_9EURY|nr:pyruvate ferredoxin oxidoreductase subunit gamma [Halapricum salinum]QCC52755.1 pyruvate ferredoxin oxidoreductase subunit gamma [Halapricum salinum]
MYAIRIHGRGGQGTVTLAQLLAQAGHEEGIWTQATPSFGVERRGAPVEAYVRYSDEKITERSHVEQPDCVIVQDTSLLEYVDVTEGLEDDGILLVNTDADPAAVDVDTDADVITVDATEIALENLGRPIMNTALLGAFAGATDKLSTGSLESVITRKFAGEVGRKNVAATTDAYTEVHA